MKPLTDNMKKMYQPERQCRKNDIKQWINKLNVVIPHDLNTSLWTKVQKKY